MYPIKNDDADLDCVLLGQAIFACHFGHSFMTYICVRYCRPRHPLSLAGARLQWLGTPRSIRPCFVQFLLQRQLVRCLRLGHFQNHVDGMPP